MQWTPQGTFTRQGLQRVSSCSRYGKAFRSIRSLSRPPPKGRTPQMVRSIHLFRSNVCSGVVRPQVSVACPDRVAPFAWVGPHLNDGITVDQQVIEYRWRRTCVTYISTWRKPSRRALRFYGKRDRRPVRFVRFRVFVYNLICVHRKHWSHFPGRKCHSPELRISPSFSYNF
jgi:hypothetical protein